jgi:hypothetical protein
MKLILNNPYRMLGLLVGASAREQTRQISRLRQYIEAEQKPDNDYSFDGLGNLDRTISSVETASSQLNLNEDKMMAALFWFYNGNKITDEPAFEALKEHDLDESIAIWEKLISNGEVSARNASAFNNLGTLYISGILMAKPKKLIVVNVSESKLNKNNKEFKIVEFQTFYEQTHSIIAVKKNTDIPKVSKAKTNISSKSIHAKNAIVGAICMGEIINIPVNGYTLTNATNGEIEIHNTKDVVVFGNTTDREWHINVENVKEFHSGIEPNINTFQPIDDKTSNEAILEKGILLKLKFLESDYANNFKLLATDETFNANQKELQLIFLNQLQAEIENGEFVMISRFLSILNKLNFSAKADYFKGFVQTPIENIERKITEVENKTNTNKAKAGDYGNELYNTTLTDVEIIESILPEDDIKLINIADKLAEVLLDCSIAVFNHFHETETEVGEIALELNKKAISIAKSNRVISRINNSTPIVQSYVNGKKERQATLKTKVDLEKIILILQKNDENKFLEMGLNSIDAARLMITDCRPYLSNMKLNVGQADETYMMISTGVASKALGYIISEVNLTKSKESVKNALSLIDLINTLDSTYDFKVNRLNPNKTTLQNMLPKSGCYIATMAYGDYDHPQVMILREFRDDVLDKSVLGKLFIETYYQYSPKLVEMLKNQKTINNLIRKLLNQLIKFI